MAIHLRDNQYRGVNAHLQSYFQSEGGWKSFHNAHITDLARAIAADLPVGYTVDIEQSLQIEIDDSTDAPEPDVTIYEDPESAPKSEKRPPTLERSASAALVLPLTQTLVMDEERYRNAIVIYKYEGNVLGKPVTRIELLSPTNKRGRGRQRYIEKREFALRGGLPLVEIDYHHETPTVVRNVPNYRQTEPNSHPYLIVVSDPRPSLWDGKTLIYGFDVDEAIPRITVPLAGDDTLYVAFGDVYQQTFASLPAYGRRVDYEQIPQRFHTYSPDDQNRIHERMRLINEPNLGSE